MRSVDSLRFSVFIAVMFTAAIIPASGPAASADGVSRFPARPLRIQGVSHIAELPDGTMAFGAQLGVALWRDGKLTTFTGPDTQVGEIANGSGLPGRYVWSMIAGRDGSLWVGMGGGLARIKDGKIQDVTPRTRNTGRELTDVMCLFELSDGRVAIGMRYGDLVLYAPDQHKFEHVKLSRDLDLDPDINNWITSVAEDREKRLWTCITGLGMFQIDGLEMKAIPAERKSWNKIDGPEVLCFDSQDNLWVGTAEGLLERHAADGSRTILGMQDGLPAGVREIHEDSPGKIWVTTWLGPCVYDGKEFRYPVLDEGAYGVVFRARSGEYWISGRRVRCAAAINWGSVPPLEQESARVKAQVEAEYPDVARQPTIAVDKQRRVWVLADRLLRFDGKKWQEFPEVATSAFWRGVLRVDSRGRVLVASTDGFWICDGEQLFQVSREGLHAYEMAETPDGVVYLGFQCGLSALKGRELEQLSIDAGFLQPMHLAVDSTSTVWFADPNGGLCRFVNGTMTWFTEQVPLRSYEVTALEPLRRGVRILATSKSLVDPVARAFEFDGTRMAEVAPPKPMLGVDGHDSARGCAVDRVFPGSAAARARIAVGDVISEFDGQKIAGIADLASAVRQCEPGERVTIGIVRKNQPVELKVSLKRWP